MSTKAPASKPKNRLVAIASQKGGIGKSTVAINLADFYLQHGIPFVGFDPDSANASFARFFSKREATGDKPETFMKTINVSDETSLDQITKAFEEGNNLVLLDGVAAQQGAFLQWMEDIGLLERKEELDLAITFVLVVNEDKDTIDQSLLVAQRVEDNVEWLVVKNHLNVERTSIYDESMARELLVNSFKAKEITFPKLRAPHLVSLLQSKSLTLSKAIKDPNVYVNDQRRLQTYRDRIWKEIESVKALIVP